MMLLYFFATVVLISCGYFLLFSKFSFAAVAEVKAAEIVPVSVIVCAKNEAENLKTHIPLWLEQDYPDFDLILINDASEDETLEVMESFAEKDGRIRIVDVKNIEAFWANKKYALTLGIKRSKHIHLIFTDADCRPASNQWVRQMAGNFSEEKQLILGYGAYEKSRGMLNTMIRFETGMTALQYFSYAKAGIPYMGVGRNLGYTSTLYYENNGFMSHIKLASGDDDLFVNETATASNTALCVSEEAFTYSLPKKSWSGWIRQKKRHLTTAKHYKGKHKLLLGSYYITTLLFWVLLAFVFFFLKWEWALALILLRFTIQYIAVGKGLKRLKETDLIPYIPLLELFLVCIQMSIFISGSSSKTGRWK